MIDLGFHVLTFIDKVFEITKPFFQLLRPWEDLKELLLDRFGLRLLRWSDTNESLYLLAIAVKFSLDRSHL